MKYRGVAAMLAAVLCCTALTGCEKKKVEIEEKPVLNFTAPAEGEEIVVIQVKDYGEIKIKLFEEEMPLAVENFKTLIQEGYYDELIFHRVIEGFMIQGGDPTGTGTGGESCWGGKFDGGVNDQLCNFSGALAYANSGATSTDGSQFYIMAAQPLTEATVAGYGDALTQEAKELYQKVGGAPRLDGGYTVFGQVIDGLDVVYEISKVVTNSKDKPKDSVYMESVTVEPYDGSEIRWYLSDYTE